MLVRLRIKPGREEEFVTELERLLPRIRDESACISITAHRDAEDPSRFLLVELWRSTAEFEAFESGSPYLREYLERVKELWAGPRDLTIWPQAA